MARKAWEEVVCDLEMKSSVKEGKVWRTHYIDRGTQLACSERLRRSEVCSRSGVMREHKLKILVVR